MPGPLLRLRVAPVVLVLTLSSSRAAEPEKAPPIPARTVTLTAANPTLAEVLKAIPAQTGLAVNAGGLDPTAPCPVSLDRTPFWTALDRVAAECGAVVVLGRNGRQISFARRTGPPQPASVDGPFRVAVRQVRPCLDFETGKAYTELTLDVHWEPRFPVFRIDSQPTLTELADDRGSKLTAVTARTRTPPSGAVYTTTVRIEGVPRSATRLARVKGSFTVTASPRMLAYSFDDLAGPFPATGKLAGGESVPGLSVELRRFEKVGELREAELVLTYPPAGPEFESFESWITENRARLVPPDRSRVHDPVNEDVPESGRRVVAVYRFRGVEPGNWKGWSLVYETPAPLLEFPVRFDLTDIPLP